MILEEHDSCLGNVQMYFYITLKSNKVAFDKELMMLHV